MEEKANNVNSWYCLGECASDDVMNLSKDKNTWMNEKLESEFTKTGVRQQCSDIPIKTQPNINPDIIDSCQPLNTVLDPCVRKDCDPGYNGGKWVMIEKYCNADGQIEYKPGTPTDEQCYAGDQPKSCLQTTSQTTPTAYPTSTPIPTSPPTSTLVPTQSPIPTKPIFIPTNAPIPTYTPIPTDTPEPTPTDFPIYILPTPTLTNTPIPTPTVIGCTYNNEERPLYFRFCSENYLYKCEGNDNWSYQNCNDTNQICDSYSNQCVNKYEPTPTVITYQAVILDPGHGSPDPDPKEGKSPEGALNLEIAKKTRELLARMGITAVLTHEQNFSPLTGSTTNEKHYNDLSKRAHRINELASQYNAKFFISIHFDSSPYGAKGPAAYYNEDRSFSSQSYELAKTITSTISLRTNDKPVKLGDVDKYGVGLDKTIGGCCGPIYILGPQGARTIETIPESQIKEATEIPGVLVEYFPNGVSYDTIRNDINWVEKISRGYCDAAALRLINKKCDL